LRSAFLGRYLFFFAVLTIPFKKEYQTLVRSVAKRLPFGQLFCKDSISGQVGFTLSDIFVLSLLVLWVIALRKNKDLFVPKKGAAVIVGIIFIALVSILGSSYRTLFTSYYKLWQLTFMLLFSFMLSTGFPIQEGKKLIKTLFSAAAVSGTIQSLIALLQYCKQRELGLKFLGEVKFTKEGFDAATILAPAGKLSFLGAWDTSKAQETIYRAYGTLGSPNILGGFLCFTIIATFVVLMSPTCKRFYSKLALWLQVFALFATFSRAAFFSAVGSALFFFTVEALRKKEKRSPLSWRMPALHFFSAVTAATLFFLPQLFYRGGYFNYSNTLAESSDAGRILYQSQAIALIKKIPLLGIGFNNYSLYMDHQVHNTFLLLAAEIGLLGLTACVCPLLFLFYKLCKKEGSPERSALIALFGVFGFIAMCDFYLITSSCGKMILFTFLGSVCLWLKKQQESEDPLPVL
jgi:O-antigen ligase